MGGSGKQADFSPSGRDCPSGPSLSGITWTSSTLLIPTFASAQIWDAGLLIHDGSVIGRTKTLPPRQLGPAGVNDQALAALPSMTTGQKQLAVILFLLGIVGIAFGLLVALFLMFRDQNRDTTKGPKRFFPSNWK